MSLTGEGAEEGTRKRLAVEIIARHERALRRTARRYSLCTADAEDAYQRALEILLTKAPTADPRQLIRWTQTVTKHEALAVRRNRERLLAAQPLSGEDGEEDGDWAALIPARTDGPAERAERSEIVARSREALQALKPAELRALTLLAEGYSYAEISDLTGFSKTKVNRSLAEGRERFRAVLSRSEDGSRCEEMRSLLSAFCDGETGPTETATLREHLRACAHCRAVMRAYRAVPRAAAALAPGLPASQSIWERAQDALAGLHSRVMPNSGAAESAVSQMAASGGTRGAGVAALAKALAVCAGTAGGAAACVAAGVVPAPLDPSPDHSPPKPAIERHIEQTTEAGAEEPTEPEPAPSPVTKQPEPPEPATAEPEPAESAPEVQATQSGAIEYTPAPAPSPVPSPEAGGGSSSSSSASAAGEFGP